VRILEDGYYIKEVEIPFCDCDITKRARVSTIMKLLADIAGTAYGSKGYTHSYLLENNFVFLLSRVSIHINRMPIADEKLSFHTWERDIKGVLFYRDFAIYDSLQNIIIEASSAWFLVNPSTRQIIKPTNFPGKADLHQDKKANTLPVAKLKLPESLETVGERKIVYSDIDANGHVYNAVYASIACDFLSEGLLTQKAGLKDFRINFKQEAKQGETLEIFKKEEQDKAFVVGKIGEIVSFECEFAL